MARPQRCGSGHDGVAMTTAPAPTWMKLARRLGHDGNPLRRRSDVIERWLMPATVAVFLALCPLVVAVSTIWIRADNAVVRHAQLSWHRVEGVLLRASPGPE